MTPETLIFALKVAGWIIGSLVTILIGISAYLGRLVLSLKDTITELKIVAEERGKSCGAQHAIIDKRLDAHSHRLSELERSVLKLS